MSSTQVNLTFPALVEHIRLARLVASGLAAQAGFTIDQMEDLRIAVDELCSLVVSRAEAGTPLCLDLSVDAKRLGVSARARASQTIEVAVDDLSEHVLRVTADEHRIERREDGWVAGSLVKYLFPGAAVLPDAGGH